MEEAQLADTAWTQQHQNLLDQQMSNLAVQVKGLRVQLLLGVMADEFAPAFRMYLAEELYQAARDLNGEVGKR